MSFPYETQQQSVTAGSAAPSAVGGAAAAPAVAPSGLAASSTPVDSVTASAAPVSSAPSVGAASVASASVPAAAPTAPSVLSAASTGSNNDNADLDLPKNSLWMGELEPWMDEHFIKSIFYYFGESVKVKFIRDKFTGGHLGYCFIEFTSPESAAKALSLNGQIIPNSSRFFKLNWASGGDKQKGDAEYSIFIGDLAPDVAESALFQLFQAKYPSCKTAKIMADPNTGMSRGYGFVRFSDEAEKQRALTEMQGVYCGSRPMRISEAVPKNKQQQQQQLQFQQQQQQQQQQFFYNNQQQQQQPQQSQQQFPPQQPQHHQQQQSWNPPFNQFTDPNNTTVFVGGLSGFVTEDELRNHFTAFGEITYVKIPPGKGCGFVQFTTRQSAETAIAQMQGYPIGNSRVRLSWGRSSAGNNNGNNNGNSPNGPTGPAGPGGFGGLNNGVGINNGNGAGAFGYNAGNGNSNGLYAQPVPEQQIPVARLNELYLAARDGRLDRVE
ncbi:hypothetical protein DV454_002208 [Geotrichum candidum]|nr:hypothetical protein DV454_002208 [Geotrichum candidum]